MRMNSLPGIAPLLTGYLLDRLTAVKDDQVPPGGWGQSIQGQGSSELSNCLTEKYRPVDIIGLL